VCALLTTALTGSARGDEIWVAPTNQQDVGGLGLGSNGIWPVTPMGAVRFAWAVPNNLQTFDSAKLALIPHSPGGVSNLNVLICTAQHASPVLGGCAGPFAQAFTGVANQLIEVDVSDFVEPRVGVAGASYLALVAWTTPTTTTDHLVGLRFTYAPTAPNGVASLSANTFSGTQTAPAFAGNGTGLTNVNADLLDGLNSTAFAPATHGHNVADISGAVQSVAAGDSSITIGGTAANPALSVADGGITSAKLGLTLVASNDHVSVAFGTSVDILIDSAYDLGGGYFPLYFVSINRDRGNETLDQALTYSIVNKVETDYWNAKFYLRLTNVGSQGGWFRYRVWKLN
jgi:hypothetical protein